MKITEQNYFEAIESVGLKNLPPVLQKGHDLLVKATKNGSDWETFKKNATIKKNLQDYMDELGEFISEQQEESEEEEEELPVKKEKPPKKAKGPALKKAVKSKTAKRTVKFEKPKKVKEVKSLREEVKHIKSFIGFHNKEKPVQSLLLLLKRLQRSIELEIIRKTSSNAEDIKFMQKWLVDKINSARKENIFCQIRDDKRLARLVAIAGGEAVYKSIGQMRRFVGMEGKQIEIKKIDSLLNSMKNIPSTDPFHDRIKAMSKVLSEAKTKGGKVKIKSSELGSLEGILGCCCNEKSLGMLYNTKGKKVRRCKSKKYSDAGKGACSYNRGIETLGKIFDTKGKKVRRCVSKKYSDAGRGACSYNSGLSGIMTAQELVNQKFVLLPFRGEWELLMGKPEEGFSMMIHGEPKNGKSSFLIQFAKYLTNLGDVLYVSSEEYGSVTLQNLVKYYMNPLPSNITFSPSLKAQGVKNISEYDFVILDSINDLKVSIEEFKKLKEENPKTSFIITLQHNKAGDFKGGKEWEHLVQTIAEIANWEVKIIRNRYGVKGSVSFYDPEFEKKVNGTIMLPQAEDENFNF